MRRTASKFEDVVDFYDHMRVPVSTMERDHMQGEFPYYGAQGVIDYVNDYIFDGEYVLIAEDGANLVTRNQPIAQIAKGRFWVNNHAHIVRAKEGISTNYFINTLINSMNLTGYVTGAAQPKLSQKNLRVVDVQIPSFVEQRRIAAILSAYDDLIENNRRRIHLLEEAARLLYREWFVHLRFPGHERVQVVDGVPDGWERKKIADVCETIGGGTPSTTVPEYWDGDITWIVPSDVTKNDCLALLDSERKITDKGLRESSAKMVPAETILMTSRASVGFFALMDQPVCTNQGFINIIPRRSLIF